MSVQAKVQVSVVGDLDGGAAPSILPSFPEASSQSFLTNSLVYLSNGSVVGCASSATLIYGIARKAATGSAGSLIPVMPIIPTTLLSMNVYHSTSASAVTAVTDPGKKYSLNLDSSKKFYYVDISATSPASVVVQAIDPATTLGDQYGKYQVTILSSILQTIVGV